MEKTRGKPNGIWLCWQGELVKGLSGPGVPFLLRNPVSGLFSAEVRGKYKSKSRGVPNRRRQNVGVSGTGFCLRCRIPFSRL